MDQTMQCVYSLKATRQNFQVVRFVLSGCLCYESNHAVLTTPWKACGAVCLVIKRDFNFLVCGLSYVGNHSMESCRTKLSCATVSIGVFASAKRLEIFSFTHCVCAGNDIHGTHEPTSQISDIKSS